MPKILSNFRKHMNTHLLSLGLCDGVRNGFLPFLDSRLRKQFLKFMTIYGWLFNFFPNKWSIGVSKVKQKPMREPSNWNAGTGGQRHQRGKERMKGGWGGGDALFCKISTCLLNQHDEKQHQYRMNLCLERNSFWAFPGILSHQVIV